MVEKLLTVGFHHRPLTLPGMTRFCGAHPPKNPQPPNAASLLPQNSLNNNKLGWRPCGIMYHCLFHRRGTYFKKFSRYDTCAVLRTGAYGCTMARTIRMASSSTRSHRRPWLSPPVPQAAARPQHMWGAKRIRNGSMLGSCRDDRAAGCCMGCCMLFVRQCCPAVFLCTVTHRIC